MSPISKNSGSLPVSARILYVFFGLFSALVALELVLRVLGFGYNLAYKLPFDIKADYRIFCVGESTTWGVGASDPIQKGYPRQLEILLNNQFRGMKIRCFFEQAIGQNTSEILLKFPRYIEKYRPQLVIFMVGTNNWWNMDRSNILLFNQNRISPTALRGLIFLDQFRVWKLFKHLGYSFGLVEGRWDFWYPRGEAAQDELQKQDKKNGRQIFAELANADIGEMIKICKANQIKMIMCNYPMRSDPYLEHVQMSLAGKYQIPFVDNFKVFQMLKDQKNYLSHEDYWHPNDQGYAVVAENIYKCILENKWIETKAKKEHR